MRLSSTERSRPDWKAATWIQWKRETLIIARERGLYNIIIGTEIRPSVMTRTTSLSAAGVTLVRMTPLTQLQDEWDEKNHAAYAQIVSGLPGGIQMALDRMDQAAEAWKIIIARFEPTDPSKVNTFRTRYEGHRMVEGQSVVDYLTTMKGYRTHLQLMGETISSSSHAVIVLRNLPESWRGIAKIRMVTRDLDEIEEKLEAHEADLEAVTVDIPTLATAFVAQPNKAAHIGVETNEHMNMERPPACYCSNCGRQGHVAERCFRQGGGLEGHWLATWRGGYTIGRGHSFVRPMRPPHTTHATVVLSQTATLSSNTGVRSMGSKDMLMMVKIMEVIESEKVSLSMPTPILPLIESNAHIWLIDSATSSHICGNADLFEQLHIH